MQIPVVENPRRRRRHRKLSAKQIAAGFGGKRHRTHRRRRNPGLASLLANPRRHRRYYRRANPRRRHRRYSNPGMLGGITGMINVQNALYVTGGIAVAKLTPGLLVRVWAGAPTTGIGRYGVQLAGVLAAATVVKMVTKSSQSGAMVVAGGIAAIAYDVLNEYVFPKIGLAGIGDDGSPVSRSELMNIGVSGYQVTPSNRLGTYQTTEEIMSV